jgi:hypothetical protein
LNGYDDEHDEQEVVAMRIVQGRRLVEVDVG